LVKKGEITDAIKNLQLALNISRETSSKHYEADILKDLARIYYDINQHILAQEYFADAVSLFKELGFPLQENVKS